MNLLGPSLPTINEQESTKAVEIKINEKSGEYAGSATGGEQVTVLTFSGDPKGGFTRYTHHLTDKKKMKTGTKFKNAYGNTLQYNSSDISVTEEVKFVHVYYAKVQNVEKPLFIRIDKQSGSWEYYKNNDPSDNTNRNWPKVEGLTGDPDGAGKNALLVELDKLNDKANGQDVIHIEKTQTYNTGSNSTEITVTKKTDTSDGKKVPQGYVAYTHSPGSAITSVKFKHNGKELKGLPTSGVTIDNNNNKLWVYYEFDSTTSQPDINKPLLIYVKETSGKWYHTSKKWELTNDVSGNPNTATGNTISTQAKTLFEGKLARQGTFKELVYFTKPINHHRELWPICK